MTYEQELQQQRNRNREIHLFLRLLQKHPKTLHIGTISETIADFERIFLSELDPDIAERLQNEITGYLEHQLKRGCKREFELVQLINEKSIPQHEQHETVVPVVHLNRSFNMSNV